MIFWWKSESSKIDITSIAIILFLGMETWLPTIDSTISSASSHVSRVMMCVLLMRHHTRWFLAWIMRIQVSRSYVWIFWILFVNFKGGIYADIAPGLIYSFSSTDGKVSFISNRWQPANPVVELIDLWSHCGLFLVTYDLKVYKKLNNKKLVRPSLCLIKNLQCVFGDSYQSPSGDNADILAYLFLMYFRHIFHPAVKDKDGCILYRDGDRLIVCGPDLCLKRDLGKMPRFWNRIWLDESLGLLYILMDGCFDSLYVYSIVPGKRSQL